MSQSSLPGLAPELKIQIFKSMDVFSSVVILILEWIIECPVEAKWLLDAQDSSQQTDDQNFEKTEEDHSHYCQAIKYSRRMFLNAESASLALEKHDTMYYIKGLKLTERKHFIQAFYRAMIMSLLSRAELPESLLASCDMLDFQRVKEVLQFTTSVKAYLGGVPVGTNGPAKDILEVMNLSIAVRRMKLLIQNFLAVASNRYLRKPLWAPTYYFIAYEKLAETTESLRGAQLAGTLPLLPEGAPWRIISDDSIEQR